MRILYGSGRWEPSAWADHSKSVASKPVTEVFKSSALPTHLDPAKMKPRESVPSPMNPKPTPICIFVDHTGSMEYLADQIIKTDLGIVVGEIHERNPVPDPHVLCGAVGDSYYDESAIQATQFEAEVKPLVTQIMDLHIERGGGGNRGESYALAWWFAAYKTDCWAVKNGRKGYLFTVGDECCLPTIPKDHIKKLFGETVQENVDVKELLAALSQNWHVFHIIVKPVSSQPVVKSWVELLGQRVIQLDDHTKLGQVIVSAIQVTEGTDAKAVAASWDGDTSIVVSKAIGGLAVAGASGGAVTRLN